MPGRYFIIAAGKDMGINADANRNGIPVKMAKLFENGNVINIDPYAKAHPFLNFLNRNTIGSEDDILWFEILP